MKKQETKPDDQAFSSTALFDYNPLTNQKVIVPSKSGLTKREWLAGMALQGFCSNPEAIKRYDRKDDPTTTLLEDAVYVADRLIEELNKEKE